MLNKSKMTRFLSFGLAVAGFVMAAGSFSEANAQCKNDPFCQPSWKQQKKPSSPGTTNAPGSTKSTKPVAPTVGPVQAPPIEARINFYKGERERAIASGLPIPKVTSVLTLDEMAVSGIFKTPRGFAAMVEATPINLSFTIYPGERFFDGQLVAIEENRLVFRKVVKMSNNKFVTSVENKALRQFTVRQEVQGTTPSDVRPSGTTQVANTEQQPVQNAPQTASTDPNKPVTPTVVVSPLDEINKQPVSKPEDAVKDKKGKKPAKVAKKS